MTTTDQPTTPRQGIIAFAQYLDAHPMAAPLPSSVYAQLAREFAEGLPEDFGEPLTEHTCGIDPDERQRAHALDCAAHWHIGSTLADEDAGPATVIATARAFEAYLRGDR